MLLDTVTHKFVGAAQQVNIGFRNHQMKTMLMTFEYGQLLVVFGCTLQHSPTPRM